MINDLKINVENYKEKYTSGNFKETKCPVCNAVGMFNIHGYYFRYVSTMSNNSIKEKRLKICRVKCKSCKSTHAVFPVNIIPFCPYAIELVLYIIISLVINYSCNEIVIEDELCFIGSKLFSSRNTVRKYLKIFKKLCENFIIILNNKRNKYEFRGILEDLILLYNPVELQVEYLRKFNYPGLYIKNKIRSLFYTYKPI